MANLADAQLMPEYKTLLDRRVAATVAPGCDLEDLHLSDPIEILGPANDFVTTARESAARVRA